MTNDSTSDFTDLTRDEISEAVSLLVAEVDTALRSNQWALIPRGEGGVMLHEGAALWHACQLLQDVVSMMEAGREMALRIVGRALLEACLIGFYIHFGGIDAVKAIESDMKATLEAQQHDADQHDAELRAEIKRVRKANGKARKENPKREAWNEQRGAGMEPLPMLEEEPEPSRPAINLDLTNQLNLFAAHTAASLTMPTVVHRINELVSAKYPGEQHFGVVYTIGFRTLSSIGPHTNLQVLQSYFDSDWNTRTLVHLHPQPGTPTYADTAANTSLALVSLLAKWILGDVDGAVTPAVDQILMRFDSMRTDGSKGE